MEDCVILRPQMLMVLLWSSRKLLRAASADTQGWWTPTNVWNHSLVIPIFSNTARIASSQRLCMVSVSFLLTLNFFMVAHSASCHTLCRRPSWSLWTRGTFPCCRRCFSHWVDYLVEYKNNINKSWFIAKYKYNDFVLSWRNNATTSRHQRCQCVGDS